MKDISVSTWLFVFLFSFEKDRNLRLTTFAPQHLVSVSCQLAINIVVLYSIIKWVKFWWKWGDLEIEKDSKKKKTNAKIGIFRFDEEKSGVSLDNLNETVEWNEVAVDSYRIGRCCHRCSGMCNATLPFYLVILPAFIDFRLIFERWRQMTTKKLHVGHQLF